MDAKPIPVYGEGEAEAGGSGGVVKAGSCDDKPGRKVEAEPIPVYGEGEAEAGRSGESSKSSKFRCGGCGDYVARHSDFLFEWDWCGEFRGKCWECSKEQFENEKAFQRACKNSWNKLRQARGEELQRARVIEYKGVEALVQFVHRDAGAGDIKGNKLKVMTGKLVGLSPVTCRMYEDVHSTFVR